MSNGELLTPLPVGVAHHAVPVLAPDADFDTRWSAWVARGRLHEQRARRRFAVWAAVLTMAAAIVYVFLAS